ncbi:hypothetical protein KTD31_03340 [Burkholderia multivorans]|jgi:hypothetical protein|uniref:hypothetical protein n=1 Tax=Burkholderia multivorans TaxID=87883 RepID=UPI001C23E4A2|nr:hypothetical protein [Burkholderia multivorans]MBU9200387.1 hypothetical protein [Burkholderia multivorans]MDN8078488.1 hypothetical protein [Burkholderia multivorans]
MDCINDLKAFIKEEIPESDLRGQAARAAASILLDNWQDAIKDLCEDNLLQDVDSVIEHLRKFQEKAKRTLPQFCGGLRCLVRRNGVDWWEDDEDASFRQGWSVSIGYRTNIRRDGPGFDTFASDDEAVAYVKGLAQNGDALAIKALKLHEHGLTLPPEPPQPPAQEYGELDC